MSDTVAIIGLGLMGASLGHALRARGGGDRVVGWARRAETRRQARAAGWTVAESMDDAVRAADVVVICTPLLTFPELLGALAPHLKPGAVVTDVGSTKGDVIAAAERIFRGTANRFVGSHPMAGSEKTGWEAARADLYEGAIVVVVPPEDPAAAPAVKRVERLWMDVGARIARMTAREHDDGVARTSHLPHLFSAVLVHTVARAGTESLRALCGPGFRDTSRLADGSPEIWHDIVLTNRTAIAAEWRALRDEVDRLMARLEAGDGAPVREYLESARRLREALLRGTPGGDPSAKGEG